MKKILLGFSCLSLCAVIIAQANATGYAGNNKSNPLTALITAILPGKANSPKAATGNSEHTFAAPTITSATPLSSAAGFSITITGTNFTGATAVSIGGKAAASFTVNSATSISAVVAQGASNGNITVTTPDGTATLPGFVLLLPPAISYAGPKTFYTGEAITTLLPTNTGGPVTGTGMGQVATYAGSGGSGTNVNGTGTAATFSNPTGIAADAQGNIYVADAYTAAIRKIAPGGVVTTLAGGSSTGAQNGTGAAASFNTPTGLAVDAAGNVFVADRGNHLIRKITPAGVVTTFAGSGSAGSANGTGTAASFNGPAGVAVDADGNLYVAEVYNNLIRKITAAGVVTTLAGSGNTGSTNGTGAAASFNGPYGITVDATGNLYVAELFSNLIRKITPGAVVSTFAGSGFQGATNGTGTAASFNGPRGVFAAADGNIYVADHANSLIRKITSAGVVTTLAGTGMSGSQNGDVSAATFYNPSGVVTVGGYHYVSDSNNNLIRSMSFGGYAIQPALPAGLAFNEATGAISGTPTSITAATDYRITAVNPYGTNQTTLNITTAIPTVAPELTSATPMSSGINRMITITGKYFLGATAVSIGGAQAASFTIVSPTTITAVIAQTAASGDIKVTNQYGTGTLAGFVLLPPPMISYAGPKTYYTGEAITPLEPTSTGSPIPSSGFGVVSTFAGSTVSGVTDGVGTAARFSSPSATATDAFGNLYVADFNSNKIRKITPDGLVSTLAGSGNSGYINGTGTAASFYQPSGLAVDAAGNVYVADRGNNLIRKITPAGVVTTLAGNINSYGSTNGTGTAASFSTPAGIAIDGSGNLFVTDFGGGLIRKITPAGVVSTFAGGSGNSSQNGTGTAAGFSGPYGIAIDAANNLYVTETGTNKIRKITPAAEVTTLAGSGQQGAVNGAGTAASFNQPRALTVDSDNTIYVADNGNQLIRKISPEGVVTTFAGKGTFGSQNGDAANATFNYPTGVAVSASKLYVSEGGNNMIRAISLGGYSITPALPGGLAFDTKTGIISGNPAVVTPATDYTILATNENGTAKVTLNIATPIPTVPAVLVSATPLSAGANRAITITGKNFLGATAVTIGGVPAASYSITSPNEIRAVVANNAANGDITVVNPYGTGTLAGFIFLPPPTISYTAPLPYTIGLNIAALTPENTGSPVVTTGYQLVTTYAGSQGAIGNANGNIASATFNAPYGIASDKVGNLYIADPGSHLIKKISAAGVVSTLAGSGLSGFADGTGTAASFSFPYGLAVDGSGNVFVADMSNNRIRKITPAGVVSTFAGNGYYGSSNGAATSASFAYPTGIAIDADGNLFVADQQNYRIRKITPAGVVSTLAGGNYGTANGTGTAASFQSPTGIAIDRAGNLYVTESNGNMIRMVTPAGVVSNFAGNGTAGATNGPKASASFSGPTGIALDDAGNVYVTEQNYNRIRMIDINGVVSTFAGSGTPGNTNGVGIAAAFYRPAGLAVDGNGSLFVADQANNQIRSINIHGFFVNPALPAGLAFDSKTGTISGKPTVLAPEAEYTVTAQNADGIGNTKLKLSVIPVSTDAGLNALTATNITMLPVFTKGLYNYTATVDHAVTGLTLTPTVSNRYATVTVDGKTVASGAESENVPLKVGVNAISVSVTAQDGTTKLNYVITVTRNKFVQTLTFPSLTAKTYGDADSDPGATSTGQALPITFSSNNAAVATIVNNKIHIVSAGTVNITASQAGDANNQAAPDVTIALTINPKPITVTADTKSKIYGSTDPALTYAITTGGLVGNDAFTGSQIRDAGEQAGSYAVKQGTLALNANYLLTYNGSKFTIDPRPITVTAVAKAKIYGDADPALTYTVAGGLIGTDTFTGTLVRDAGEDAGSYAIKQGSVAITSNYAVTYAPAALTVTPRPVTITSAAKTKTYGQADPAFTYSITTGNLIGADAFTGALARQQGQDVGSYDILQGTVALSANYALTYVGSKLTVDKKALTVRAEDKTRNVGKADPVFTVTYQGFEYSDTPTMLTTQPVVTTTATATSLPGSYPLIPAGAASNNYTITYVNGKLSVIPPANNFKLSSSSVTCRGQNNGTITVAATQSANYTALLTGNSVNKSFTFTTTLTMDNLAPGTYRVCISDAALPEYQSCFDLVITEPKDLSVYSSVNKINNTVQLTLNGSASVYNINLNGKMYTTTENSITLPIHRGINKLAVTTDKDCQGIVEKEIDMVDGMKPFPNPFQDVMYINLGNKAIAKATVKIYSVSDGTVKFTQQFTNQSGVIKLNVSNLMMGAYSLHLTTDGTETIYKVIKQ